MTTLSIITFPSPDTAQRRVQRLDHPAGVHVAADDAAIVSWSDESDRPDAWQASLINAHRPLAGAFWGLLFAHLFLIPLSLAASPRDASGYQDESLAPLGFDANRLASIRETVEPGTSAVFAIHAEEAGAALVAVIGDGVQGRTSVVLDDMQTQRLYAGFADEFHTAIP